MAKGGFWRRAAIIVAVTVVVGVATPSNWRALAAVALQASGFLLMMIPALGSTNRPANELLDKRLGAARDAIPAPLNGRIPTAEQLLHGLNRYGVSIAFMGFVLMVVHQVGML